MPKEVKDKRQTTCRDCSQCTQTGVKRFGKKMVNIGTLGGAALVAKTARAFKEVCPVCGHPMDDHRTVDGKFQD